MKDPAKYFETLKAAQADADRTGADYGLEYNRYSGYRYFRLPAKTYRAGHELRCQVVTCSDLDRCLPGHGPCAIDRNPAATYHGGPRG